MWVCASCHSIYLERREKCALDGGTVEARERDPFLGQSLGPYSVEAPLGSDRISSLYEARSIRGTRCCLRILYGEVAGSQLLVDRFRDRARVASRLRDDRVLSVLAAGTTGRGISWSATELASGPTLEQSIALEAPIPARRAVTIAAEVAGALAEAHRNGVVHGSLDPSKVLLLEEEGGPRIKVSGFDIAGLASSELRPQITARPYLGPPGSEPEPHGNAGDIYALGVLLYQLLNGTLPQATVEIEAIQGVDLLLEMLEQDPGVRPSAQELSEELRSCLTVSSADSSIDSPPIWDTGADGFDESVGTGVRKIVTVVDRPTREPSERPSLERAQTLLDEEPRSASCLELEQEPVEAPREPREPAAHREETDVGERDEAPAPEDDAPGGFEARPESDRTAEDVDAIPGAESTAEDVDAVSGTERTEVDLEASPETKLAAPEVTTPSKTDEVEPETGVGPEMERTEAEVLLASGADAEERQASMEEEPEPPRAEPSPTPGAEEATEEPIFEASPPEDAAAEDDVEPLLPLDRASSSPSVGEESPKGPLLSDEPFSAPTKPKARLALGAVAVLALALGGGALLFSGSSDTGEEEESAPAGEQAQAGDQGTGREVAPAAPAAKDTVDIDFVTSPEGALIFRDGSEESLGTTPTVLSFEKGERSETFLFRLDGHEQASREVSLSASSTVSIELAKDEPEAPETRPAEEDHALEATPAPPPKRKSVKKKAKTKKRKAVTKKKRRARTSPRTKKVQNKKLGKGTLIDPFAD